MAAHVIYGDLVRDSLKTEIVYQAVEQRRGIVPFNCRTQTSVIKLVEQVEGASETADLMNNADGMVNGTCLDEGLRLYRRPLTPIRGTCPAHRRSNQRYQLALDVRVTIDIRLSGLD
jgi:hypothetical protein